MPDSPEDLAKRRLTAIEALQEALANDLSEAQTLLYEGLLQRLEDIQADPETINAVLADFNQAVHLPVVVAFGESLLELVDLNLTYVKAVGGVTDAQLASLRAPLDGWLRQMYGIGADGKPIAGGYLGSLLTDTTVGRQLKLFAYQSQISGVGPEAYRKGLKELITNTSASGGSQGVFERLYAEAFDQYNISDRLLQSMTAETLGWTAFLYNGGLIKSSRAFCVVRQGKVFLKSEIDKFGTKADAYGGYTNKATGDFNGKPSSGYDGQTWCGGWGCRHSLSSIPNTVAMNLRSDLKEDSKGRLYIKD
jgi:hypothetical protein